MLAVPFARPAPATQRCIWCGLTKPIDDFAFRNSALGTRQSHCRKCHAAYRRVHYLRNRPEYIAREANRIRERRKQNRRLLQEYLRSHPCVDCGETDIVTLQFSNRTTSHWEVQRRRFWIRSDGAALTEASREGGTVFAISSYLS